MKDVGVMKDEELQLEEIEASLSHTRWSVMLFIIPEKVRGKERK